MITGANRGVLAPSQSRRQRMPESVVRMAPCASPNANHSGPSAIVSSPLLSPEHGGIRSTRRLGAAQTKRRFHSAASARRSLSHSSALNRGENASYPVGDAAVVIVGSSIPLFEASDNRRSRRASLPFLRSSSGISLACGSGPGDLPSNLRRSTPDRAPGHGAGVRPEVPRLLGLDRLTAFSGKLKSPDDGGARRV